MKSFILIFAVLLTMSLDIILVDFIFKGLSIASTFINFMSILAIPVLGLINYYIIKILKICRK